MLRLHVFRSRTRFKSEWASEKSDKTFFGRPKPDPTRPRYEDPGQNVGRSFKDFKEQKRAELLLGEGKRKIPLKALVPEEYRGARYYTDVHMEAVEKRNAMPKVFRGPYSIVLPHRDGRMEHPGDRVPCAKSIHESFEKGTPLKLPEGFEDSSRYALAKKYEIPLYQREIRKNQFIWFLLFMALGINFYRYVYLPHYDIPDPFTDGMDRFFYFLPFLIFSFAVFNIGGVFTNKFLLQLAKMRSRLRK